MTPDEGAAPAPTGTPAPEAPAAAPPPAAPAAADPAETDDGAAPADQPAAEPDRALGQAEYTRSQQAFSQLKAVLGLDRSASREDVIAAVEARRAGGYDEGEGDDGVDLTERERDAIERERSANARAFGAEIRVQAAIYGQEFTNDAILLTNALRQSDDPSEIVTAIDDFRRKYPLSAAAGDGSEPQPTPPADPNTPPAPVGLSEGDAGPSARQPISANAARQESGPTQVMRKIFADLGIASRPTDQS